MWSCSRERGRVNPNNTSAKEDEGAKEEKQHLLVKLEGSSRGSLNELYYTLEQVAEHQPEGNEGGKRWENKVRAGSRPR